MTQKVSAEKELFDMTECSICNEVFIDPRVLPCIHTFCLKCLVNYGKDRQAGDDGIPCPLCEEEFTVPSDGIRGIRKNFLMEKVVQVRKNAARLKLEHEPGDIPCDVCSSGDARMSTKAVASMYCDRCEQNYCDQCSLCHRKMKSSYDHVLVQIARKSSVDRLLQLLKYCVLGGFFVMYYGEWVIGLPVCLVSSLWLVQKRTAKRRLRPCDVCGSHEARMHCVRCQLNYCKWCSLTHRRTTSSRHVQKPISIAGSKWAKLVTYVCVLFLAAGVALIFFNRDWVRGLVICTMCCVWFVKLLW